MIYILIHGSWHTGEAWHKVEKILTARGTTVYAPTLSGMASMANPGGPDVGLTTHIDDIVRLIETKDLTDVILVGHSYSGIVITGVADRLPERVSQLVYLDAFIPENNQSLFDIMGPESAAGMRAGLVNAAGQSKADGATEVWLLPPGDARFYLGDDADEAEVAWLQARLVYKPVRTFEEKLRLERPGAVRAIPGVFIRCTQFPYLAAQADKARALGWPVFAVESGHDAMLTAPEALSEALLQIGQNVQ
ncbi:MAG: alpha/beta hydrolase [Anaerolineae bacterium]